MPADDVDPAPILRALAKHGVGFVVVGGLAGMAVISDQLCRSKDGE